MLRRRNAQGWKLCLINHVTIFCTCIGYLHLYRYALKLYCSDPLVVHLISVQVWFQVSIWKQSLFRRLDLYVCLFQNQFKWDLKPCVFITCHYRVSLYRSHPSVFSCPQLKYDKSVSFDNCTPFFLFHLTMYHSYSLFIYLEICNLPFRPFFPSTGSNRPEEVPMERVMQQNSYRFKFLQARINNL